MPIISKTIPNLVGIQMYYIPPEVVDPLATPIYQNWDSNIIIDEIENRIQYDASTNPDNVLIYSWNRYAQDSTQFFSEQYFTITAVYDNSEVIFYNENKNVSLYYSFDKTTWTSWDYNNNNITLQHNQSVYLKGNNLQFSDSRFSNTTSRYQVSGNIMSLIYGDDFKNKTVLNEVRVFAGLFQFSSVYKADNLILPATTLSPACYLAMFSSCETLMYPPELPATTLATDCYSNMFRQCFLVYAPDLPATTLAQGCYQSMFSRGLYGDPPAILPAKTLATNCYYMMFYDCGLSKGVQIEATTGADFSCASMFYGSNFTEFPDLKMTTLAEGCLSTMFFGCNKLQKAPKLPATTLAPGCYGGMFAHCSSLTTAPELPATTLAEGCYSSMFEDCSSLTTAPELPALTLEKECYYMMFLDCTSLNYVKAKFTTNIPYNKATDRWLENVSSTGSFYKNANATWNLSGESGVPQGWSIYLIT